MLPLSQPIMNRSMDCEINQKIIDALIQRAEQLCPNSLALIGVYGSCATGDLHPKSDLDLLVLINDPAGQQLADAFLLDDPGVGYDIYCTDWEMLEGDAQCGHAHLSKLMDTVLVYVKDAAAPVRLEALRRKAASILASDQRHERARAALDRAKSVYANCFLTDSVSQIRQHAGGVIHFLLDALMLEQGRYFKKGVKRTFEEVGGLSLPFDAEALVMDVIFAETAEEIRRALTALLRTVQTHLLPIKEKGPPNEGSLSRTYEEMFSNWRNKMWEAAERNDIFSSFMNLVSFRHMLDEIAETTAIEVPDVMAGFHPRNPEQNAACFDDSLCRYLAEYRKAGIRPRRFANIDEYLADQQKADSVD